MAKNQANLDYETTLSVILLKARQFRNTKGFATTLRTLLVSFIVPAIIGLLLDMFAPTNTLVNYIRALMVLVMWFTGSLLVYLVAEEYVTVKKRENPTYQSARERTALRMRRYAVVIVLALVGTISLVTASAGQSTVLVALCFIAALQSLVFARTTEKERKRAILGLPDPRERNYDARMEQLQKERTVKAQLKAEKREQRKKNSPFRRS